MGFNPSFCHGTIYRLSFEYVKSVCKVFILPLLLIWTVSCDVTFMKTLNRDISSLEHDREMVKTAF